MAVRCKFVCESVRYTSEGADIAMKPVTSGSPENDSFYKRTPSGKLYLFTVNKGTANQFIPGKEYYLDITLAE